MTPETARGLKPGAKLVLISPALSTPMSCEFVLANNDGWAMVEFEGGARTYREIKYLWTHAEYAACPTMLDVAEHWMPEEERGTDLDVTFFAAMVAGHARDYEQRHGTTIGPDDMIDAIHSALLVTRTFARALRRKSPGWIEQMKAITPPEAWDNMELG